MTMQPFSRHLLVIAAAALAWGCTPEGAGTDARAEAAASLRNADAGQGIAWLDDVEAGFAVAGATGKPVFLYWGAEWCPYCADLKAHVFARRDVQEKLKLFVPVYLDGDSAGAQKWGEEFAIAG